MGTSITPVLSTTVGYLTDVRDQIAYLLRYFIMNPANVSDVYRTISMRDLAAQFQSDRNEMAIECSKAFQNLLIRKFPDYTFNVKFTASDYIEGVDDTRYKLEVSIYITNHPAAGLMNTSAIVSGAIEVDPLTYDITIKLADDLDSSTI